LWINPKTNWTNEDYYNAEDINRVENNTLEVANYLNDLQYVISLETVKTDRNMTSIDFLSSINRIERNIDTIKNNFLIPPDYQNKKNWTLGMGFSYLDANRWENNLNSLYKWALAVKDNYKYCGTFYIGEEVILNA
jgi:hypothetical protein